MDKISMTYFIDFVLKTGTAKLSVVKEVKSGRDKPYTDFYRKVRQAIMDMHTGGESIALLDDFVAAQRDERRQRIYPIIVAGYRRFLSSSKMSYFEPPLETYPLENIDININPEIGMVIDGTPHIIKMYFRGEPLSDKRTSLVLHLLSQALGQDYPEYTVALLDVRNAKLHTYVKKPDPRLGLFLRGEAASFATLYQAL